MRTHWPLTTVYCLLLTGYWLLILLSEIGLQVHQFPKPRLQPLADLVQVPKVTAPVEEHRHRPQHEREAPGDEAKPSRPQAGHQQQRTIEPEEAHGEYRKRATGALS